MHNTRPKFAVGQIVTMKPGYSSGNSSSMYRGPKYGGGGYVPDISKLYKINSVQMGAAMWEGIWLYFFNTGGGGVAEFVLLDHLQEERHKKLELIGI